MLTPLKIRKFAIKVTGHNVSKRVQQILFSKGYQWIDYGTRVINIDYYGTKQDLFITTNGWRMYISTKATDRSAEYFSDHYFIHIYGNYSNIECDTKNIQDVLR